jgi:hypothetical protein
VQHKPLLSITQGWDEFSLLHLGVALQDSQKSENVLGATEPQQLHSLQGSQLLGSGEGAAIQTGSLSQLGGSDPKVLPRSVNQSFQFTYTTPFSLRAHTAPWWLGWAGFP